MEKLTIQEEEVMIYIWELQCCFGNYLSIKKDRMNIIFFYIVTL